MRSPPERAGIRRECGGSARRRSERRIASRDVAGRELERPAGRGARRWRRSAGIDNASAASLQDEYRRRADASLEALLSRWHTASDADCLRYAPDSRRPSSRCLTPRTAGAADSVRLGGLPAWMAVVDRVVRHSRSITKAAKTCLPRVRRGANAGGEPGTRTLCAVARDGNRRTIATTRRLRPLRRGVSEGDPAHIDVHVNASHAVNMLTAARRRFTDGDIRNWCTCGVPQRPAMEKNEPEAGHIDGDTLRTRYLDHANRPGP